MSLSLNRQAVLAEEGRRTLQVLGNSMGKGKKLEYSVQGRIW